MPDSPYDLLVIGGGINGAGVAADAAGRGLSVCLCEMGDLAGATSSASSKLIHGGLRYLEHWEFRLVREALQEREVLMARAPHIIWPLRFVLPYVEGMRARPLIRAGLWLYDHLAHRARIPASREIDLRPDPAGEGLKPSLGPAFEYWDCWVDDSRLVILNARLAADKGADIRTRTRVTALRRGPGAWMARLEGPDGPFDIGARTVVNAAGPWAADVARLARREDAPPPRLRLVKGSHIVVPRIPGGDTAFLLQNRDGRVVFLLPFESRFTLIGTTDVPVPGQDRAFAMTPEERDYLLDAANAVLKEPLTAESIAWSFAGARPLYDDAEDNPSAVTRDYRLDRDGEGHGNVMLTILGGKITTYRRLAEAVLERLRPEFPALGPEWTAHVALPGGDLPDGDVEAYAAVLAHDYPGLAAARVAALVRRYGTRAADLLGDALTVDDLGADLGGGLTEREVAFLASTEWARTADDVLWRRTKAGLAFIGPAERDDAARRIGVVLNESARNAATTWHPEILLR